MQPFIKQFWTRQLLLFHPLNISTSSLPLKGTWKLQGAELYNRCTAWELKSTPRRIIWSSFCWTFLFQLKAVGNLFALSPLGGVGRFNLYLHIKKQHASKKSLGSALSLVCQFNIWRDIDPVWKRVKHATLPSLLFNMAEFIRTIPLIVHFNSDSKSDIQYQLFSPS